MKIGNSMWFLKVLGNKREKNKKNKQGKVRGFGKTKTKTKTKKPTHILLFIFQ